MKLPDVPGSVDVACYGSKSGTDTGTTRLWDNGTMRISIKRLPDDQWKEFILIIGPSQGQRVGSDPCTESGGAIG